MDATAFDLIEDAWFSIRDNFDDLLQAAATPQARKSLLADRDGARDAYYHALGKAFDEQDHFVQKTKAELAGVTGDLKAALRDLQNLVAALALVSSAVKLMAALAAMVV
ncbi:MAG TPA: hypothetical protein VFH92_01080 [Phenylobacterium sp.]|nr:hypothetical protein [Phenylobacterium sp.]